MALSIPRIQTLRIVESDPEASLHPRDIWNHWKRRVIWDPRTYYGLLECIGIPLLFLVFPAGLPWIQREANLMDQKIGAGLLLLVAISPLHWFSNHRVSSRILTRAPIHVAVLLLVSLIIFLLQITTALRPAYFDCWHGDFCILFPTEPVLWAAGFISAFAAYLVYTLTRHPRKDSLLAELPSPIDVEETESSRAPWTSADVFEGFEDDSPEIEGQIRL